LNSKNDKAGVNQLYLVSTRITLAIFVAVGFPVVILAKPFLAIWVGEEYTQYTGLVYLLTAASFLEILTWPAGAVLQGISRHHLLAPIAIGSGIANLILSIVFVKPLGLSGIALATLIPNMIECLFFVLPYTLRTLKISGHSTYKDVILPVLPSSIVLLFVLLLLRESVKIASFISMGLVGGIGILVYSVMYVSLGKNLQERKIILNWVHGAFQAGAARLRS
jgi:O-antigen/teichoic acid export membrane protein